jgi:hypothetical protein
MLELIDSSTNKPLKSRFGELDFGSLQLGQSVQRSITIRNAGNQTLNLGQEIHLGPGFAIVNSSNVQRTLQPGQTTTLTLRGEPTTFGTLQSELNFQSDDAENKWISLVLKAKVVEELILTADDLVNFKMAGVTVPTGKVAPTGNPYSKRIAVGYNRGFETDHFRCEGQAATCFLGILYGDRQQW